MKPKQFILALDQGTTSCRAILFDRQGCVCGLAQRELLPIFPRDGWVEHDPSAIWKTQLAVGRQAIARGSVSPDQIAGIAITNQRETVLLWQRSSGKPIGNAIVWQDRRTADRCAELKHQNKEPFVRRRTGLLLDPYFSATKLEWLLTNHPQVRPLLDTDDLLAGTIDSWLLWKLTAGKVHATEPSNASRTMLCNLETASWDKDLCKMFSVPREILPEIKDSSGFFGETTFFGPKIPILGIAGDQQAALFGQACHLHGTAKSTYGTGCFLLMHTGKAPIRSRRDLISTIAWQVNQDLDYALEGSVFMGGAIVQWLRDGLKIIRKSRDVESLAGSVQNSDGVVLVPAFTGLGAPYWDPSARGLLIGMTRATTAAHIARAALDAIALQVADVLDAMVKASSVKLRELRVDGGAAGNDLLMQIQADIAGIPVVRAKVLETTALGAAYLAGLAAGMWSSTRDIRAQWQADKRFEPRMKSGDRELVRRRWADAIGRSGQWS